MNGIFDNLFKNWIFWIFVIACGLLYFLLYGCYDRGHVQTRFCEGMDCRVGTTKWIMWDGEPEKCTKPVQFFYLFDGGEPIQQSGLEMTQFLDEDVYWVEGYPFYTDKTDCIIGNFTGAGGFNTGQFQRLWLPERSYCVFTAGVGMCRPSEAEIHSEVGFATAGLTSPEFYPRYISWGDDCSEGDKYIASPPASGELTSAESQTLAEENPVLPESGIDFTVTLLQQQGNRGKSIVTDMSGGIIPIQYNDADRLFQTAPFIYSYLVHTSEPAEILLEQDFMALVKSNMASVSVGLEIIATNDANTVFVARTEPFIVMSEAVYDPENPACQVYDQWSPIEDPNVLNMKDPNFVPDPNRIIECPILPMQDVDTLRIEFVIRPKDFLLASPYWLSDSPVFDLNKDGIVNWKDYSAGLSL